MARRRRPPSDPTSRPFTANDVPSDYVRLTQPPAQVKGTAADAMLKPPTAEGRSLYPGVTPGKRRRAEEQRYGPS